MNTNTPNFAVVMHLIDVPDLSGTLKRLALFCDEIRFYLPSYAIIPEEVFTDQSRVVPAKDGGIVINDFNYFKDVHRGMSLPISTILKEFVFEDRQVLQTLIDLGIAKEMGEAHLSDDKRKSINHIRDMLISLDIQDKEVNKISGTKPEDYLYNDPLTKFTVQFDEPTEDGKNQTEFLIFNEPNAVRDSYDITHSLLMAEVNGYHPIFPIPRHRKLLEYRYKQYIKGQKVLAEYTGQEPPPSALGRNFGELIYTLSNEVFTSDAIDLKSIEDVIKYRNAMKPARDRFFSLAISELTQIIEESPWSTSTIREIKKYIRGKLNPELMRYQDESREIWEKLYGDLTINLSRVVQYSAVGAAGSGILGSVIPGTTMWGLLTLGALAGASKEMPKLVESLVTAILGLQQHRRNSIAYIAQFK